MPDAASVLRDLGGVVSRRDLLAAGATRRGVARALSDGAIRLLEPHVLGVVDDTDGTDGTREVRVKVALAAVTGAVASHEEAARLWGLELHDPDDRVHVTVGRDHSRTRPPERVVVHRADLGPSCVEERSGIQVTSAKRTALDLCRYLPLQQAVVAVDSGLRQGLFTLPALVAAHALSTRGPGRPRVTLALSLADPWSGSALESLFRLLVHLAGLPPAQSQHPVRLEGRLVARVDFAWPDALLVVETDGFAFHADRETFRNDRRRTNALVLGGWRVLRFSWEDVVHHPDRVVAEVRAALAAAT